MWGHTLRKTCYEGGNFIIACFTIILADNTPSNKRGSTHLRPVSQHVMYITVAGKMEATENSYKPWHNRTKKDTIVIEKYL